MTMTNLTPTVTMVNGRPMAKSTDVAVHFGKRHKNILRSISSLERLGEFWRLNFEPRDYVDERGKPQPMVEMTKDGFTFLVMGFIGEKADAFKIAYINEFNRMEVTLRAGEEYQDAPVEPPHLREVHTEDGTYILIRTGFFCDSTCDINLSFIESSCVANLFKRPHHALMQRIRRLSVPPELHARHFVEDDYVGMNNHELPQFLMTRDGFNLLTAGWHRPDDSKIRAAVYEAFDIAEEKEWYSCVQQDMQRSRRSKLNRQPPLPSPTS